MEQPVEQYSFIKKFGLFGFLLFFIKGLLWLALPALMTLFGVSTF